MVTMTAGTTNKLVRIWCLRHAETEYVTTGATGGVPAAPLTVRGHHQAIAAAHKVAAEPITRVYSSTALRARQTAELLATTLRLPITAMPELVEVGIGKHEGMRDPAIRAQIVEVLRAW